MSNPNKRKWVDSASGVGPTAKRPATTTITPASATHSKAPAKSNKTQGATDPSDGNQSKIPLCPTHRRRCNMKEVRKEGPNLGRWFFSCVVRACTFFQVRGQSFQAYHMPETRNILFNILRLQTYHQEILISLNANTQLYACFRKLILYNILSQE